MKFADSKLWAEAEKASKDIAKGSRDWHASSGKHSEDGLDGFQAGAEWGFMRALRWLHENRHLK